MIELVKAAIANNEKYNKSWIMQGFPRTQVQALSLHKIGIIPDNFIELTMNKQDSLDVLQSRILGLQGPDADEQAALEIAERMIQEYDINMGAVKETFNQFIYSYDRTGKQQGEVNAALHRMMRIRHRNDAPRRPPRIMLIGPPGSGRSTQAQQIADAFGLVNVSPANILRAEAERNPPIKIKLQEAASKGESIPDEIILCLVDERLRQSDCRVNGWVLDGFPETESQVNLLKSMRINPTLVCKFE